MLRLIMSINVMFTRKLISFWLTVLKLSLSDYLIDALLLHVSPSSKWRIKCALWKKKLHPIMDFNS